jgi:UDP-N-acetylmuramyl pentapeptide phosphotransferase/UDP-N-acetylglucosamine-1-phosphate transferase
VNIIVAAAIVVVFLMIPFEVFVLERVSVIIQVFFEKAKRLRAKPLKSFRQDDLMAK